MTVTLAEAQKDLAKLAVHALKGEQVLIEAEGNLLKLETVLLELPENYLSECYGPEELAEEDYLTQWSRSGSWTF